MARSTLTLALLAAPVAVYGFAAAPAATTRAARLHAAFVPAARMPVTAAATVRQPHATMMASKPLKVGVVAIAAILGAYVCSLRSRSSEATYNNKVKDTKSATRTATFDSMGDKPASNPPSPPGSSHGTRAELTDAEMELQRAEKVGAWEFEGSVGRKVAWEA